jgi:hypothetical protein
MTEDQVAAFIEQLGGKVTRDANLPGRPVVTCTSATSR